jgi:hypothetical protein
MMDKQVNEASHDDDKRALYMGITEAEALTGIPNATLKRYILNHPQFIHFKKMGREYRIRITEIEKLKIIRKLYNEGHKMDVVNEKLGAEGLPITITSNSEEGLNMISVNEEVAELKTMLALQNQLLQQVVLKLDDVEKERVERERLLLQEIQESNQLYQQNIGEVKQLLNRHESERVSELRLSMEEVSATVEVIKKEVELKQEAARNKSWWQKLLGR